MNKSDSIFHLSYEWKVPRSIRFLQKMFLFHISDLEEFDEEDAEEDEDSKLAMQISKLLSEEDEAMMEEDLEDFFKE